MGFSLHGLAAEPGKQIPGCARDGKCPERLGWHVTATCHPEPPPGGEGSACGFGAAEVGPRSRSLAALGM